MKKFTPFGHFKSPNGAKDDGFKSSKFARLKNFSWMGNFLQLPRKNWKKKGHTNASFEDFYLICHFDLASLVEEP